MTKEPAKGTKAVRLACLVPFCRHSRGIRKADGGRMPFSEWICEGHWKNVPAPMRAEKLAADKESKKAYQADPARWRPSERNAEAWEACRAAAIEIAMGIG